MFWNMLAALLQNLFGLALRVTGGQNMFQQPLSPAEELEYFHRARAGDREARNVLVERNMRLVVYIVKKYFSNCEDQDDLISIGTLGLIKAVDTFDAEKGARFATYASKCLQNEILMHFRSQKRSAGNISLYDAIDYDREGNELSFIDIICVDDTIAEDLDQKIKRGQALHAVRELLDTREREIVRMRYGLDGGAPLTQREVAVDMGISRSYVSRLEKSALEKIKEYVNGQLKAEDYIGAR